MLPPSGEKVGYPSARSFPVTARICFATKPLCCTPARFESPECGEATRTNVIDDPSGDQVTGDAGDPGGQLTGRLHAPDVSRCASPPAEGSVQRWLGSAGDCTRKLSFSTSNESLNRSGPFRGSVSSSVTKANDRPSGDHAYCCTPFAAFVTR